MQSLQRTAANVVRGGLIGTVEVVPGVSGGTVALIVGIYETIITSAGAVAGRRPRTAAPGENVGTVALLVLLGAVLVGATLLVGNRAYRSWRVMGVHARR